MPRTTRPPGAISSREKIRLVAMLCLLAVAIVVVVNGLAFLGGTGEDRRRALDDPDETARLPDFDRGPLRDAGSDPASLDAALGYLLGLVAEGPLATAGDRGYARPTAAEVTADPAAWRGAYVKVVGRVVETRSRDLAGQAAQEATIRDADGAAWRVVGPAPRPDGEVVKVAGVCVGPDAASVPVVVAIRTWPSVIPERFERIDPVWARLARDGTTDETLDLRTPALFYALAWARSRGPSGFVEDVASGVVAVEPMPTGPDFLEGWRKFRGTVYRVEGTVDGVDADHDVPENPSGLESVYLVRMRYDRGGRKQWRAALLAPRGALPRRLGPGDRVVAEGLYLRVWSTDDERGQLVQVPLLVTPRVRHAGEEER